MVWVWSTGISYSDAGLCESQLKACRGCAVLAFRNGGIYGMRFQPAAVLRFMVSVRVRSVDLVCIGLRVDSHIIAVALPP